ncbi:MAG: WLM domain-containing protein [Monoraphidium minutum]|nr:MAG: WLM domain-containing protein [Monoraphidium minutum]
MGSGPAPAGAGDTAGMVLVSYRGRPAEAVPLAGCASLSGLAARLERHFCGDAAGGAPPEGERWAPETVKITVRGAVLRPHKDPDRPLADAGITPGSRLLLLASGAAEVARVRAARELAGLAPFEAEDARAAARRRRGGGGGASGPHHFGAFRVLEGPGLTPPPAAARALLARLACDPAIAAVMAARGWRVPLLSEMPPEGRVGVSAVCVLGFNVNQGQEISLRLRTDDMRGFRKYLRIRETLVHELAHNEVGPHDATFKALNSQLLREVAAHEAAAAAPGRVLEAAAAKWRAIEGSSDDEDEDEDAGGGGGRRAAPAGVRLGGGAAPVAAAAAVAALGGPAERFSAGAAALQRAQLAEQQRHEQHAAAAAATAAAVAVARPRGAGAGASAASDAHTPTSLQSPLAAASSAASGSGSEGEGEWRRAEQDAGHFDPGTAAKEREMAQLGSLDEGDAAVRVSGGSGGGSSGSHSGSLSGGGDGGAGSSGLLALSAAAAGGGGAACADADMAEAAAQPQSPAPYAADEQQHAAPGAQERREPGEQRHDAPQEVAASPPAQAPAPLAAVATAPSAAPGGGANGGGDCGGFDALDSPAAGKVAAARAALQQLHIEIAAAPGAGGGEPPTAAIAAALAALCRALSNVVAAPGDPRYQALRLSNPAVAARLGRWRAARALLRLAGFEEAEAEGGAGGRALVWRRRDPGLAWLVLSVVRDAAAEVEAAATAAGAEGAAH